jgi:hypothetical protein
MVGYRRPERPEPETYFKAKSSFVGSSLPIGAVVPSLVRAFPTFLRTALYWLEDVYPSLHS